MAQYGAVDKAKHELEKAPHHPASIALLAKLLLESGMTSEARLKSKAALRLEPDNPVALNVCALVEPENKAAFLQRAFEAGDIDSGWALRLNMDASECDMQQYAQTFLRLGELMCCLIDYRNLDDRIFNAIWKAKNFTARGDQLCP